MSVSTQPLVYVIVLTCNGLRYLEGCFSSLQRTEYENFRVILVDNASTDGSAEFTATRFPEIRVLRNSENLGFARGNNVALEHALAEDAGYVMLLNDDTVLLAPRWLATAVRTAESDPGIGMIGFRILDQLPTGETRDESPHILPMVTEIPRIDGCALFMRAALLRQIGLFDEVYFAYSEEDDLETRAQRMPGGKLVQLDVPIYHYGGGTSKKIPWRAAYLQMRNGIRYALKQRGLVSGFLRFVRCLDVCCNPWPLFLIKGDDAHRRMRGTNRLLLNFALLTAAGLWNLLHLPQTWAIRRAERKREQSALCNSRAESGAQNPCLR